LLPTASRSRTRLRRRAATEKRSLFARGPHAKHLVLWHERPSNIPDAGLRLYRHGRQSAIHLRRARTANTPHLPVQPEYLLAGRCLPDTHGAPPAQVHAEANHLGVLPGIMSLEDFATRHSVEQFLR